MKFIRFTFFTVIVTFTTSALYAQSTAAALKANAFPLDISEAAPNKRLADILRQHSIIMMGEMHGTQEPALFVSYMVEHLVQGGKTVNLGLEIPAVHMKEFIASNSSENLKQSLFFSKGFPDGRPGSAWFTLINKYIGNPSVHLFFFDIDPDAQLPDCDKGMYATVKDAIQQHPGATTVLLSGNIHNRLIPFGGANTLACYLQQDTLLHAPTDVLAINHQFKFGAMENVTSEGFGVHKTGPTPTSFSETLPFKTYFSLLNASAGPYNAVFYTEEVTPSSAMTRQ